VTGRFPCPRAQDLDYRSTFSRKDAADRYAKTVHDKYKFWCPNCGRGFTSRARLKTHRDKCPVLDSPERIPTPTKAYKDRPPTIAVDRDSRQQQQVIDLWVKHAYNLLVLACAEELDVADSTAGAPEDDVGVEMLD